MVTSALSGTRFSLLLRRRGQRRSEFRNRRHRLAMRLESLEPRLMLASVQATPDANSADPFIIAKAAELNHDPAEIFQFMREDIAYEAYAGSLRGARGTLWSGAGNALDQASLMIALLRASGIESQYAQGTLPDEFAQELILSMFPEPLRVTGFVPEDAILADPANDPQLLADTRDHYWVQYDVGAGLLDADPSFRNALIDQTFTSTEATFDEVFDTLRHKTTVRLNRELTSSDLFGGAIQDVASVLDETFNTVDLVGKPLSIGHIVSTTSLGSLLSATTHAYSPYIAIGDYAKSIDEDERILGTAYQEVLTNFPFGSQALTGLFLEVELTAPGQEDQIFTRALVDRIGIGVRQNGGTPAGPPNVAGISTITDLDIYTLNVAPSLIPTTAVTARAAEVQTLQTQLAALSRPDGTLPIDASDELRKFAIGISRLNATNYFGLADFDRTRIADTMLVRAYSNSPQLVITSFALEDAGDGQARPTQRLDLRHTDFVVVPYPGQNSSVVKAFHTLRGLRENAAETAALRGQLAAEGEATVPISATTVIDRAIEMGISPLVLSRDNAGLLPTLQASADARARISLAIQNGQVVAVPSRPVEINGEAITAWFEIDPLTGKTVGVTEDGGHQSFAQVAAVAAIDGFLIGFLRSTVIVAGNVIFNDDCGPGGDRVACKEAIRQEAANAGNINNWLKGFSLAFGIGTVALAFLGTAAGGLGSAAALTSLLGAIDPPVPEFLISPETPLDGLQNLSGTGVVVDVVLDPSFTFPAAGNLLPTVYRVGIKNELATDERFQLSVIDAPTGFDVLTSVPDILVPAGATAEVGLALRPQQNLPAPGTMDHFVIEVTSETDSTVSANSDHVFVVPEIHGIDITANPAQLGALPGVASEVEISISSTGNVNEFVDLEILESPDLMVSGIVDTSVDMGETTTLTLTLVPDSALPLNSVVDVEITADFGGIEQTTLFIPVTITAPGAAAVASAASAVQNILGNAPLGGRLTELGTALTNLSLAPGDSVFLMQALVTLDSIVSLLTVDPILVSFADPVAASADALAAATTPEQVRDAIVKLGAVLENFSATVFNLSEHNVELFLTPNSTIAQPQTPATFELRVHNISNSSAATTYNISLGDLPIDVSGTLSETSVTLERDEFASVIVTLTPNSTQEVPAFEFDVTVAAEGFPDVTKTVNGALTARREFVSVVSVTVVPPFADAGGTVDVSARVLNAVNRVQQARASFVVRDSSGAQVGTVSAPVDVTLGVQTSLVDVSLGTFDTTGLVDGNYTVVVTLVDENGAPIPGAIGQTTLLIGAPVTADLSVTPQLLPPGASTVTNTFQIEGQDIPTDDPLTLLGQLPIQNAARGVAIRGDVAYVSGGTGINVVDVSDPESPQLVRTVGSGDHAGARLQDDLLVAIRTQGFRRFFLDVYSIANDPLEPVLLGSSDLINYDLVGDLQTNPTHAFVAQFQECHFIPSNDVFLLSGDLLSIALNLDDPDNPTSASPALESVLFNTYGDNTFDPNDISGCAPNGGEHNVFSLALPNPQTVYLATTTVTGGNTQAGVGQIAVVDVSDAANPAVLRNVDIPGTVQAVGVAVDGNRGVVIGTTGGWNDPFNGFRSGVFTVTTLDLTDPLNPQLVKTLTLDREATTFWTSTATVENGIFTFSDLGFDGNEGNPEVLIIDASILENPFVVSSSIPLDIVPPNSLSAAGSQLYLTDADGLTIYEIGDLPRIAATAAVQIPNGVGVEVVDSSFNISPDTIIPGPDFDTLLWNLSLTALTPIQDLSWETRVNNLQPGESRNVTLATQIDFSVQGTVGELMLPRQNVFAEQVLSLAPAERTIQPGESTSYSVSIGNPSINSVTYDLSTSGLPPEWVELDPQVTVPAGGSVDVPITLQSDPFAPLSEFGFVVTATVNGSQTSVEGTLSLVGDPVLPDADAQAHGVVVSLSPTSAVAGQGTAAAYVARITNVGSITETFDLSVVGLPSGFTASLAQTRIDIPPGASNFREVVVSVVPPADATVDDYMFEFIASSMADATVMDVASGQITVLELGVGVEITPNIAVPGSIFQMLVTNTGQVTETYDLSVAAPAALAATLETTTVTLDPGASQTVPIEVGAIDFAFPGVMQLVGVATSRTNAAVRAADSVEVSIDGRLGVSAGFDQPARVLPHPGPATLLLQVDNVGNLEDQYSATIMGTDGPITAALKGLDGQPALSVPLFILPGLSTGVLSVDAMLTDFGVGEITVQIRSLSDDTIVQQAIATVMAASPTPTTLTIAPLNADRAEGDAGNTPFTFTVTRGGNVSGPTTVEFNVSGSGSNAADAVDFGGSFPFGQVMFAANETSQALTVSVSGDTMVEPDESFTVTLSGATDGATIESDMAVGLIRNDDRHDNTCHQPLKPLWWQIACKLFCHHAGDSGEDGHSHHWPHRWPHDWAHGGTIHGLLEWAAEPSWLGCWLGVPLKLWHALDVDRDGSVAPFDALHVINHLNHQNRLPATAPLHLDADMERYDIDQDGLVSAYDALMVVNHLNRMQRWKQSLSTATSSPTFSIPPAAAIPLLETDEDDEKRWDDGLLQLIADDLSRILGH